MRLYRIISIIIFPLLELYVFYRIYKKKEDKKRFKERFGQASVAKPDNQRIIWIHAVSVGEANSAITLIDEILQQSPQNFVLFTTTTLTSSQIISEKLSHFSNRVAHQFLPLDSYFCVVDFLKFWQPETAIFVESEIWPNLISQASIMGTKVCLVNARISQKSYKKWQIAKKIGFRIFDYFDFIFAQTKEDQERIQSLSKNKVLYFGNLKSQARELQFDQNELAELKRQISNRPVFLAASTHKGEEEIILQAHNKLQKEFQDLLTIIVLRHPNRADEVKEILANKEFAQRSKKEKITQNTQIYLVDSLGELGVFYRLTNFAFIGGSLVQVGGHNPFEPIKIGCAIISGKKTYNFNEIYSQLNQEKACIFVDSPDDLVAAVKDFLNNAILCQDYAKRAKDFLKNDNIAQKICEVLTKEFNKN